MAAKKVNSKTTKITEEPKICKNPEYNEFGVCIACQGGDPNCHHQNLTQIAGKTICVTCGACVSE